MDPDDHELVQRVKRGDKVAFDLLMQRYQQEMITVAYRMLGQYQDAVDLAQEAFLRAYQGLPRFREEATFRTWLYQIVLNLARHRRRWYARHRVSQTVSLDTSLESDDSSDPIVDQIPSHGENPRESATHRESQQAIETALAQLPMPFRMVIVLREIEGLSYEQIAAISREQVGTVKSRLHRARAMLRKSMEDSKRGDRSR